jgi:hypothetical protein
MINKLYIFEIILIVLYKILDFYQQVEINKNV